jgi:NAD(P)-dependent dehydrogenase (short-subunit alcohol dehydrogenase family)
MAPLGPFPSFTPTWHTTSYPSISPNSNPTLSIAYKNVIITGGGSGASLAILHSFALTSAAYVGIIGQHISVLEATATSISAEFLKTKIHTYSADIVDKTAIDTTFAAFEVDTGKIDVCIQNAGYQLITIPLSSMSPADFKLNLDINMLSLLYLIRAFLYTAVPKVVLAYVSSGTMHLPSMPEWSGYTVAKEATTKMFTHVAVENPSVRVHVIHPRVLKMEMSQRVMPDNSGVVFDDSEYLA